MAYSSLAEVKEVLDIKVSETTWDSEITICITSADGLIDSLLKFESFSVPLAPTPQNINDASKYFAAWLFRRRRDPVNAETFWEEAQRFLEAYTNAEKKQPVLRRV